MTDGSVLDKWYRRTTREIEAGKDAVLETGRKAWEATFRPKAAPPRAPVKWERLPYVAEDRSGGSAPPLNEGHPLNWPVEGYYGINARDPRTGQGNGQFGPKVRTKRDGTPRRHDGLDITAPVGTVIRTAGPGRTTHAGVGNGGPRGGYGYYVDVDHGDGLVTKYAHLSRMYGKVGDTLLRGQRLGEVGRSGNPPPDGQSHLHFETIRKRQPVNPYVYLGDSPMRITDEELGRMGPSEYARFMGLD